MTRILIGQSRNKRAVHAFKAPLPVVCKHFVVRTIVRNRLEKLSLKDGSCIFVEVFSEAMIEKKIAPSNQESKERPEIPDCIWIFGYGSLIWKPDFPYECSVVGHVKGFVRRFWQGSTWHRGSEERPGRVVTLVEEKEGQAWGIAYKVSRECMDVAMGRLNKREKVLGGYELYNLPFYPGESESSQDTFSILLYAATTQNTLYLGPECPEKLALQIVSARGKSGPNMEYLFRLADFMREKAPTVKDEHLFLVDTFARRKLGLCVDKTVPWTELVRNNSIIGRKLTS